MDLTKVSARIRPRHAYEAMDLGFLMVRRWWKELFLIQLLLFIALGGVFYLASGNMALVMLLLWLFKPVVETFHLQFLGRALFDADLRAQHILRYKWSILFHELFAKLTWRRFHPLRCFIMPVAELEQLRGKTRLQRIRVLTRHNAGSALWVTLFGAIVEIIITLDILLVTYALLPKEITDRIDWNQMLTDELLTATVAFSAIISMVLVMPFYVAAGFSLYINRRTWLEGWDIELAFRQLARRSGGKKAAVLPALLVASLIGLTPQTSKAANDLQPATTDAEPTLSMQRTPPVTPRTLHDSRSAIIDILEGPDFRRLERRDSLRPVAGGMQDGQETPERFSRIYKLFAEIGEWLATISEALLWAGLALFALILARSWPRLRTRLRRRRELHDAILQGRYNTLIFGPETYQQKLPTELLTVAERLWHEGHTRDALSLLYRGAIASLTERFHLPLDNSCTEIESLELCQQRCPAVVGTYFNRLTQAWMRRAYGNRDISTPEFQDLIQGWGFFHPAGEDDTQ